MSVDLMLYAQNNEVEARSGEVVALRNIPPAFGATDFSFNVIHWVSFLVVVIRLTSHFLFLSSSSTYFCIGSHKPRASPTLFNTVRS